MTANWENIECQPCRGRGVVLVEDAQGLPTHEVVCPYCGGRQDSSWVAERRHREGVRKAVHRRLAWLAGILVVLYNLLPRTALVAGLFAMLWLPMIWAWIVAPTALLFRAPRIFKGHAPGFTDDREVAALGLFAAALALKGEWDAHHHHHQAQGLDR